MKHSVQIQPLNHILSQMDSLVQPLMLFI